MSVKVGDKIFSPQHGFLEVLEIRGSGRNKEVKFEELGKPFWVLASRIQ
jgi:hypothetical protein